MDLRERGNSSVRHPWEVERARFYLDLMWSSPGGNESITSVLDVGAGDAYFASRIAALHDVPVLCVDTEYTGETEHTDDPRVTLSTSLPTDSTFDAVFALDVLEHVPDPDDFLSDVRRRMHPGSRLLIGVPAHPRLYTEHDTSLGHRVRYTRRALHEELGRHFEIVSHGSLFTSLLLPRALEKGLEKLRGPQEFKGAGAWTAGPRVTSAVAGVLRLDAKIGLAARHRGLPWTGLSHWALCAVDRVDY